MASSDNADHDQSPEPKYAGFHTTFSAAPTPTSYDDCRPEDHTHYHCILADSAATSHVLNAAQKDRLTNLHPANGEFLTHGDTRTMIEAFGDAYVKPDDGEYFVLRDVAYVPSFQSSLVSLQKAHLAGWSYKAERGEQLGLGLYKPKGVKAATATLNKGLCCPEYKPNPRSAFAATSQKISAKPLSSSAHGACRTNRPNIPLNIYGLTLYSNPRTRTMALLAYCTTTALILECASLDRLYKKSDINEAISCFVAYLELQFGTNVREIHSDDERSFSSYFKDWIHRTWAMNLQMPSVSGYLTCIESLGQGTYELMKLGAATQLNRILQELPGHAQEHLPTPVPMPEPMLEAMDAAPTDPLDESASTPGRADPTYDASYDAPYDDIEGLDPLDFDLRRNWL
ncbi:hypothetical protein VTO42DRAFT_2111 [Malbranchea cinnamomea]